jgi:hypothetical protein
MIDWKVLWDKLYDDLEKQMEKNDSIMFNEMAAFPGANVSKKYMQLSIQNGELYKVKVAMQMAEMNDE